VSCERLSDFAAGGLDAGAADRMRDHVATCAACQAALLDILQLDARAAAAGARTAARITPLRRRWPIVIASAAVVAAAAAIAMVALRGRAPSAAPALALAPGRSIEGRLSAGAFDRHRPYAVSRAAAPATEAVPARLLADLEAAGDRRGLAAGQLLAGNRAAAEAALTAAPATADTESDRALLALLAGRTGDAITRLDAVLAAAPDHPQARWNLGLAYRDLELPLMAAGAFARVAGKGEAGWSAEAAERADAARAEVLAFGRDYQRFYDAALAFAAGTGPAPAAADWRAFPGIGRLFFYDALRASADADRLAVLALIAAGLDADAGGSVLADSVARIAAGERARRAPIAARYAALVSGSLDAGAVEALIADARRAGATDIVLGAMVRGGQRGRVAAAHIDEYRRLAAASPDPWLQTLGLEQSGLHRAAARWADGAAELRAAAERCRGPGLDYRCARVHHALADGHLAAHEVSEARRWSAEAAALARRARDWHLQLQVLFQQAEIEHFADDVTAGGAALVRAHLGELLARAPTDCSYAPYAHTLLGTVAVTQLDAAAARREYDLAYALHQRCGLPLSAATAFLAAQVLPARGSAGELTAVQGAIGALRDGAAPGTRALLDHIEGRLLFARDPAAGRRLLTAAIAGALAAGAGDLDAAKARAYSYAILAEDAAVRGQLGDAFGLVADELGVAAPARCAVAALIEDHTVAIVRDPDGAYHGGAVARRPGPLDAAALIPAATQAHLAGCAEVAVLARSPIHGRAQLLPASLVWAYHGGRPAGATATGAGVRLVIADVAPPAGLGLPRLAAHRGAPGDLQLTGAAATPSRVLARLADADHVEIHAHGVVDRGIADGAYLALSPDADGGFALTARQVRAARLPRQPVVVLAACDAGQVAPYFHAAWSLPSAFIAAGARAVIASTAPVPDAGAAEVFADVSARIRAGASAARALHDVRQAWRARPDGGWLDEIVVFE
jgi:hypothetical protein